MTIEEYRPESDEKNVSTPSIVSLDDKTTNASHISMLLKKMSMTISPSSWICPILLKLKMKEIKLCRLKNVKTFPKACFWSVVLSSALIMEGYDTNLLASFTLIKVLLKIW